MPVRTLYKHASPITSRQAAILERIATIRAEVARILKEFPDLRPQPARARRGSAWLGRSTHADPARNRSPRSEPALRLPL
jgi:hypothetical protein